MPTNYPGDKTHTQSPSVIPQNEGVPTVALPADGDPPNASTFAQGFKVLADWIAYVLAPVVKVAASAADWARSAIRFRAANGHTRSHVDHLGLISGRIQNWREHWDSTTLTGGIAGTSTSIDVSTQTSFGALVTALNSLFANITAASVGAALSDVKTGLAACATDVSNASTAVSHLAGLSPWRVAWKQTSGSSTIITVGPDVLLADTHRIAGLCAGDTAGDYALLYRGPGAIWSTNAGFKLEWEAQLEAADLVKDTVTMGFCTEGGFASGGSPANDYAVFTMAPGGGHWFFNVRSGGGSPTAVDTLVSASTTKQRFKVEWHGATVAEDTIPAIRAYIDGVLVATVLSGLPAASAGAAPHFCCMNTGGGAAGLTTPLRLGPVSFGSNLYPSDVT